jgi:hypothetical protein
MFEDPSIKLDRDKQIADDPSRSDEDRQAARLRQLFWQARYQAVRHSKIPADTFLAFYANLALYTATSRMTFPRKRIMRDIDKFFSQPRLAEAMAAAGPLASDMLHQELYDAAVLYFTTCKTDTNYTSALFNIVKLKEHQIAAKAAGNAVDGMLAPLIMLGDFEWRDATVLVLCQAYAQIFPENGDDLDARINQLKPEIANRINRIRQAGD